jgi:hypothetical protein
MRSRGGYERPPAGLINSARRSENLSHVRGSPSASLSVVYLNMLMDGTELHSLSMLQCWYCFVMWEGAGRRTDCLLNLPVTWRIIG